MVLPLIGEAHWLILSSTMVRFFPLFLWLRYSGGRRSRQAEPLPWYRVGCCRYRQRSFNLLAGFQICRDDGSARELNPTFWLRHQIWQRDQGQYQVHCARRHRQGQGW